MREELFKQLVTSMREGGAILRGETAASRKFVVDKTDVKHKGEVGTRIARTTHSGDGLKYRLKR